MQIADAIAALFHIGSGGADAVGRLVGFLRPLKLLLILDNCDPLIAPAAMFAGAALAGCAGVSILATSRASLGIPGESVYRLPPLPFPPDTGDISAAGALAHDAVRLFVERAVATIGSFTLDDTNAPFVARICSRLDGIALAIEMAVPRLQVLHPAQLADRLNERFRLLTAHDRAVLAAPSHAARDDRLELRVARPPQSLLLRRLSVFAGGATLAAVAAVAADGVDAPMTGRCSMLLASLVDKSLVVADSRGPEPRYRLLETMRHYAREKLIESWRTRLSARHAALFRRVLRTGRGRLAAAPIDRVMAGYLWRRHR